MNPLKPVSNLWELYRLAEKDERYMKLLICSAENLGGKIANAQDAKNWLETCANHNGDEDGIVDEVNFCLDLV